MGNSGRKKESDFHSFPFLVQEHNLCLIYARYPSRTILVDACKLEFIQLLDFAISPHEVSTHRGNTQKWVHAVKLFIIEDWGVHVFFRFLSRA